ncbi:HD domain-containing protein [Mycobacterium sp. 3519A]|uniref:HD domain-containing protein n=1 Tax=Mycobacterium sp. 3519A TaxID=2057184 RepID=UPI00115C027D|nr:HD domain-containing protein [Mycobacterium sp. 3519A]
MKEVWSTNYQQWFTDHGTAHSRRVASYAMQLTQLPLLHDSQKLTTLEMFILWASAWLHDIGMQDLRSAGAPLGQMNSADYARVRHEHPERSSENILHEWRKLGLPDGDAALVDVVADVARAHGTKFYKDTVENRLHDVSTVRNKEVRPRLLAAILLFADELDLHNQRVVLLGGWPKNNAVSEAHSFKHSIVRSVRPICERNGGIAVELELLFPPKLPVTDQQHVQRWIEVKLQKQMGMVEPQLRAGFTAQAHFDRIIRTSVSTSRTQTPLPSAAALAIIRAETSRDELINHQSTFDRVQRELDSNGVVVVVPRGRGIVSPRDDGRADLVEALAAAAESAGRKTCVSRQADLALGATTASDVLAQWLACLSLPVDGSDSGSADVDGRLNQLLDALTSQADETYLFGILGGEFLNETDLVWIAEQAVPRIRERCPTAGFAITNSVDRSFVVPGTAVTTVSMSDLSEQDVADYLRRFTGEDVAAAESRTLDSYSKVKLQGQEHLLAQRR